MSNVLVTGATGFLGSHLLEMLDASVRVFARAPQPELEARGIEIIEGDLLDPEAVKRAVEGTDTIFHLAGKVSRDPDDVRELYRVHVEGTTLLCRAAKGAGVRRMVLASTSGTIAVTEDGESLPDESWPAPLALIGGWPYYTSKLYQEEAARRECDGGPELVILNPSLLLGPGDERLSSTEDVLKFLASDIPVVPPGGINFVDVRDVARTMVNARAAGRPGERYLLGGPNWTFQTFFERLSRLTKVKGPSVKLPESVYEIAGKAMDAFYRQWDLSPPVDKISIEMGQRFWYLDCSKAERELGFHARDPYETLYDTVAYIKREFLNDAVLS